MKLLKIKPYDNTFFGSGMTFGIGSGNIIKTKNIAYPSTFFGAIFTALLANNDELRDKFLSKKDNMDHYNILNINQIYLYDERNKAVYIKSPKDIFIDKYKQIKFGKYIESEKDLEKTSSLSYKYYLEEPDGTNVKRADDYFIDINNFNDKYRYKDIESYEFIHEENVFLKNNKTGIALNSNKVNKDNYLYTIEQTEFKNIDDNDYSYDWSYVVEYTIDKNFVKENYGIYIEDLPQGQLKLGGENKVCNFNNINNNEIKEFKKENKNSELILKPQEKLKLIFTSDTYFTQIINDIFKDDLSILALVNDKPIYIGGYDLATKKEKTMCKGYSAGTILLLKNISEKDIEIGNYLSEKIKNTKHGFNQYIYIKGDKEDE